MLSDKWEPRNDPIFENEKGWWFLGENNAKEWGPYKTEEIARDRLEDYCNYIGGCGIN